MIGNYIKAAKTALSTAKLMKTGQTTSYRTGDDGDIEAGRNTSFTVLAENNPFGNTNRFTDELGTQTYTKNIVIDWSTYDGSTVLGYRRTRSASVTWNNAIDGALLVSIAPYTTGWRVPNFMELQSILNFGTASGLRLNYAPFNISTGYNQGFWTSTSSDNSYAYVLQTQGYIIIDLKVYSYTYIPCRTFTVTGTTLS